MSEALYVLVGAALLAIVLGDVYATILHARAKSGLISETINRTVWRVVRAVAFRLSRQRRHILLNSIGPLLLPLLLVVLLVYLVVGFALIYMPWMPSGFNVAPEAVSHRVIEALYFSGITLTTVGYGDITPHSTAMRVVALAQSASGFVLISLGVTYLVTVYGALERKRLVALSFYHRADEGADAAALIAHHFVEDRFYGLDVTLRTATRDIQTLLEAHIEHPIIHYFHPREVHKGMPRLLFLMLETCVVIKACLSRDQYRDMYRHPELLSLDANARYVLSTLTAALDLTEEAAQKGAPPLREESSREESRRWRRRWQQTLDRLQNAGIDVRQDQQASWRDYQEQRSEWEAPLYRFALYLGYDWDEVTGDRNLEYAADEEMAEPEKQRIADSG